MKVLVTGGCGFLGTNVVHALLEDETEHYEIRILDLLGATTKYIEHDKVEIFFGSILNPDDTHLAMDGMDYVIHCAGDTSDWFKNKKKQRNINVEGTRNVMEASLKHHIKRNVHTSTIDTFGYNPNGLVDENWTDFNYTRNNYAVTKREGEMIALSYVEKGLDVVVINPGSMIGPYDHTLQYGRLYGDLRDGKVPGIPPGGVSWGHVTEVAKAHVIALKHGRTGEKYICAGDNATYEEVFSEIAKIMDVEPPKKVFPKWTMMAYAYFSDFVSLFSNKPPQVSTGRARDMCIFQAMDSTKAQKELGYRIITVKGMVEDAYNWYKKNGFL